MRVTGLAALALALSMAAPSSAAEPQDEFVRELRAQNAHHIASPPGLPEAARPRSIERDWEEKISRESWELIDGPLTVTVTLAKGGPPDGMLFLSPVLSLLVEGREVARAEGSESFPDNPIFVVQVAELDPSNPFKEVVFSTFTGGAHCCSDTRLLTSDPDGAGWREIEVGFFDGGPLEAKDLDGDGRYEFAMRDNAFLYAFGCYACSTAPLKVLRLEEGRLKDVSADKAFRPRQVQSLLNIVEWAGDDADRNGFLAGYVAQKILLGEGEAAWKLMLRHHDRAGDWGLDFCAVKENDKGECPPGKTVTLTYPEALKRFLAETGYKLNQ